MLATVDGTGGAYARPGATAIGSSLSLSSRGGGVRLWRTIGPPRGRVVGVAQSRRGQHSRHRPVEQDFRSGGEQKLDLGAVETSGVARAAVLFAALTLKQAHRSLFSATKTAMSSVERMPTG
jgi:hypothetical protein